MPPAPTARSCPVPAPVAGSIFEAAPPNVTSCEPVHAVSCNPRRNGALGLARASGRLGGRASLDPCDVSLHRIRRRADRDLSRAGLRVRSAAVADHGARRGLRCGERSDRSPPRGADRPTGVGGDRSRDGRRAGADDFRPTRRDSDSIWPGRPDSVHHSAQAGHGRGGYSHHRPGRDALAQAPAARSELGARLGMSSRRVPHRGLPSRVSGGNGVEGDVRDPAAIHLWARRASPRDRRLFGECERFREFRKVALQ